MKLHLWMVPCLFLIFSCTEEAGEEKGKALVQVYDEFLYEKDIKNLLSGEETPEDSALIINAYIERWLRNQVMLYEAARQIEDMKSIDDLVEDYKNSLILYDYEEQLTTARLDTVVRENEIKEYYIEHQKDFVLNQNIVGLMWWQDVQVNDENLDIEALRDSLRNGSLSFKPVADSLGQMDYFSYRDLTRKFPELDPANLPGQPFSISRNGTGWTVVLLEKVAEGATAPLPFVRDEIEKLILHRRKIKLLQKIKEDNYQRALKRNQIKYFN